MSEEIECQAWRGYPLDRSLIDRLLAEHTWRVESGCLIWIGGHNGRGYGVFQRNGLRYYAHRAVAASYLRMPESAEVVNHTCGVPQCVDPDHLEIITQAQNTQYRTKPNSNNSSGHRGVTFHGPSGKWMARATLEGKQYVFGYHESIELAVVAVTEGRKKIGVHGD